ncbi:hypothetical protein PIB30_078125 [Stylosanthes scabra]|uniref:Uncharacterized protein n=1 Tax=Stylosanthes scabra TaxID=79078 RepID=A0ABU6TQA8_9FABA|nr:hypothetical protein [Stylosanthes scabra]
MYMMFAPSYGELGATTKTVATCGELGGYIYPTTKFFISHPFHSFFLAGTKVNWAVMGRRILADVRLCCCHGLITVSAFVDLREILTS